MDICLQYFHDILKQMLQNVKKTLNSKNSNLRLSLYIHNGLCEHIEKELPWSVMLITRTTRATPSFVDPRPGISPRSSETPASRSMALITVPNWRHKSFKINLGKIFLSVVWTLYIIWASFHAITTRLCRVKFISVT